MRDTLVMAGILVGVAYGLMSFRQLTSSYHLSSSSGHVGITANQNNHSQFNENNKGAKDERSNNKYSEPLEGARESERSSGNTSEVESLPSIYSRKKQYFRSAIADVRQKNTKANIKNDDSPDHKLKNKVLVPGVPIQAFLDSQRNNFYEDYMVDDSMKVYLWCMELKKEGLKYSGPRECQKIGINPHSDLVMKASTRN